MSNVRSTLRASALALKADLHDGELWCLGIIGLLCWLAN